MAHRSTFITFFITFVVPTIILFTLSDPTRLGPLPAMFIALAFPVGMELYGLAKHRKPNLISIAAIVGILLIGVIAVLGLDEQWLAIRRSALYVAGAAAVAFIVRFKPKLLEKGLDRVLDMERIKTETRTKKTERLLMDHVRKAGYAFALVLALTGVAAYILTIVFMNAPAGSSAFNAQYAELRIISIGAITVPLMILLTAILIFLFARIERITGVPADELVRKKK